MGDLRVGELNKLQLLFYCEEARLGNCVSFYCHTA